MRSSFVVDIQSENEFSMTFDCIYKGQSYQREHKPSLTHHKVWHPNELQKKNCRTVRGNIHVPPSHLGLTTIYIGTIVITPQGCAREVSETFYGILSKCWLWTRVSYAVLL